MPYKPSDLFSCRKCGQCCNGYGGTFVTEADVRVMAAYVNISPEAFVRSYCRRSGVGLVLAQKPDGYCVFYASDCRIHPVKPRMCRAWPFIENLLRDMTNWRIMAASCPGINADAPEAAIRVRVEAEVNRFQRPQPPIANPIDERP